MSGRRSGRGEREGDRAALIAVALKARQPMIAALAKLPIHGETYAATDKAVEALCDFIRALGGEPVERQSIGRHG